MKRRLIPLWVAVVLPDRDEAPKCSTLRFYHQQEIHRFVRFAASPSRTAATLHPLRACDVLFQNHFGSQQNFRPPTSARSPTHAFSNPNFRRPHNPIPPRCGSVVGLKLVGHCRFVKHGVWGFGYKGHVTGCDFHHEHELQTECKSVDGLYPPECHRFYEID